MKLIQIQKSLQISCSYSYALLIRNKIFNNNNIFVVQYPMQFNGRNQLQCVALFEYILTSSLPNNNTHTPRHRERHTHTKRDT